MIATYYLTHKVIHAGRDMFSFNFSKCLWQKNTTINVSKFLPVSSSIVRLVGIRLLVMHQKWISEIEEIISDKKLVL